MKKLIKTILLTFAVMLCSYNVITVFAADTIVYGRLRTEISDKKSIYADIFIDSNVDLCIGAVLLSFSYDATELKFISAQLNDKSLNDRFETYCDENGTVNVLYGNAGGKTIPAKSSLPFIKLKFRRVGAADSTAIGIECHSFVNNEAKEIDISYIDVMSFEINAMLDDPTVTPAKLADKHTAGRSNAFSSGQSTQDNDDVISSEDFYITQSDGENEQQYNYPLVINSESNTVRSMVVGGIIMLCVSVMVFWGYKVGVGSASGKNRKTEEPQDGNKNDKTERQGKSGYAEQKTENDDVGEEN